VGHAAAGVDAPDGAVLADKNTIHLAVNGISSKRRQTLRSGEHFVFSLRFLLVVGLVVVFCVSAKVEVNQKKEKSFFVSFFFFCF
jgi:hypothetical protein